VTETASAPGAAAPRALQTARLQGEPLGPQHEAEMLEMMLDPRVYRTLWPWSSGPTPADIRVSLADKADHWCRHRFGLWLLRDRSTGQMVGRGGLQYTDAPGNVVVEAAWAIVPDRWGEGLATELARASVAVGLQTLALAEIVALTLPENHASRRVMEKAGLRYARDIDHVGLRHLLYRRTAR
jgi:ribosomal-protein-alanine N-acetyltransferase